MATPTGILMSIPVGILNGCHGFNRDGYASPVTHPPPSDGYIFSPTTHPWMKIYVFTRPFMAGTRKLWVFSPHCHPYSDKSLRSPYLVKDIFTTVGPKPQQRKPKVKLQQKSIELMIYAPLSLSALIIRSMIV